MTIYKITYKDAVAYAESLGLIESDICAIAILLQVSPPEPMFVMGLANAKRQGCFVSGDTYENIVRGYAEYCVGNWPDKVKTDAQRQPLFK